MQGIEFPAPAFAGPDVKARQGNPNLHTSIHVQARDRTVC